MNIFRRLRRNREDKKFIKAQKIVKKFIRYHRILAEDVKKEVDRELIIKCDVVVDNHGIKFQWKEKDETFTTVSIKYETEHFVDGLESTLTELGIYNILLPTRREA